MLVRTVPVVLLALVAGCLLALPAAATEGNPLLGRTGFVDPNSHAAREAAALRTNDPDRAALFDRIATRPQADWFGDWIPTDQLTAAVADRTATIRTAGTVPVYVVYAVPGRDCGGHSAGGVGSAAGYREWVDAFAAGLDGGPVVVVVEPDALGLLDCLSDTAADERTGLLRYAVDRLSAAGASAYLDAGHSSWHDAATMAERLRHAGVDGARGFALNVSNVRWTADEVAYARELSARTGGTHAVIDTSRNGRGPAPDDAWCNPDGRGLGPAPTTATADPVVDAYLWIKRPGESDGTCNGGPAAGVWWAAYAEGLASRAALDEAGPTEPARQPTDPLDPSLDETEPAVPGTAAVPGAEGASRVAGPDRVGTAVAVSAAGWSSSRVAVLARSDDPADALAGTAVAGHHDAPLMVTPPDGLDTRVAEELDRLGVREVVVLGGPAAVTDAVVSEVRAIGVPLVRRLAGDTRHSTAVAAAGEVADRASTVLLVAEHAWVDALSVAGLAARRAGTGSPWPLLLTGPELPAVTRDAIRRLGAQEVVVVGGPAVVPTSVDAELAGLGVAVRRLAGGTRHATSLAAAELDRSLHGATGLVLATSAGFADGLAAGAFAARTDTTLLLVPPTSADPAQRDWVRDHWAELGHATVVGGPAAVTDEVAATTTTP